MSESKEIKVRCLDCDEKVGTGMWTTEKSFKSSSFIDCSCFCPRCDNKIVWSKKDVVNFGKSKEVPQSPNLKGDKMTRVKCHCRDVWGACQFQEGGFCHADEIKLFFTMDSPSERCTTGHMKCDTYNYQSSEQKETDQ